MTYTKKALIPGIICFFLQLQLANAQAVPPDHFETKRQEAIAELKKYPNPDTARVNALIAIFSKASFLKQRQDVAPYRIEALALSRKLQYAKGLAYCWSNMGHYYKGLLDKPSAQLYFDSALNIIGNSKEPRMLGLKTIDLQTKGYMYYDQENYYAALNYFFEALKYSETNPQRISNLYIHITDTYVNLNNLEKAEEYAKKNIELVKNDSDFAILASVYFPYIDICVQKNDLTEASLYLDKIAPNIPDSIEVQVNVGYYEKRGQISYQQQKYSTAFMYFQQAYKNSLKGNHKASISYSLGFLSATALKLGNTEAAKTYALQNMALADELNTKTGKIDALINLATYYNTKGNSSKAYEMMQHAAQLKDSLTAETNIKQINILGTIYETDKKQKEIIELQAEKEKQAHAVKQKSVLNKVFFAAILILLAFGYMAYRNFRTSQKIANQNQVFQKLKILELEKDKQLLAIDAMLKGQEDERSRIAKDLHDGLSGLLSGTKLSFMNVKETLVMEPQNAVHFDRSLSMLDNAIADLRKMAHNLMPEALVKFGLNDALRDFCDSIQFSSGLKITYQQFGEKRKLGNTAEVFIYRIIQELVNNVVKHADASQMIVQLTMSPDKTAITVEDDGKGFNKDDIMTTKGAGIANIKYRVQYFNGTLDVVTSPGNGTSVNIELIT